MCKATDERGITRVSHDWMEGNATANDPDNVIQLSPGELGVVESVAAQLVGGQ